MQTVTTIGLDIAKSQLVAQPKESVLRRGVLKVPYTALLLPSGIPRTRRRLLHLKLGVRTPLQRHTPTVVNRMSNVQAAKPSRISIE